MGGMSHVITIAVRLDRPMHDDAALPLARAWAADSDLVGGMCSHGPDGTYSVSGMTPAPEAADPVLPGRLARAASLLAAVLAGHGYRILGWDSVELLSEDAVNKRLRAAAMPDVVNADQFAELLDVTRQRVYQLEADRKAGRREDFPRPVLDGYWLRSMAERYAATRRTAPGPAPKAAAGGE